MLICFSGMERTGISISNNYIIFHSDKIRIFFQCTTYSVLKFFFTWNFIFKRYCCI